MTDSVYFTTVPAQNDMQIGVATLNRPKALNALNLEMIRLLMPQLLAWQQDDKIAAVVLHAEGDKAFCAGGDVVAMHNAMAEAGEGIPEDIQTFFTEEYQLDHLIHSYPKPFIVWGTGIVMGGGLGLMSGASHRIVTETSRIAMPEISIGLYPDVGGSYFLNQMPDGCGLFLGLTGAPMNAADALYVKLADHFVPHQAYNEFMDALVCLDWQGDELDGKAVTILGEELQNFYAQELPHSDVQRNLKHIKAATSHNNIAEVVDAIVALDAHEDKWLQRAAKTLRRGSPLSAALVYRQLSVSKGMALADCFRQELIMSCRCGEFGEFQEGVRALLIDKDNKPAWRYTSVDEVPTEVVDHFFSSPFETHPLAAL